MYARNARTHSEDQVAQIAASIKEWGWTTPVLVDEAGGSFFYRISGPCGHKCSKRTCGQLWGFVGPLFYRREKSEKSPLSGPII
jgi:hypothetical protein